MVEYRKEMGSYGVLKAGFIYASTSAKHSRTRIVMSLIICEKSVMGRNIRLSLKLTRISLGFQLIIKVRQS